jgi:hypothetical protein
MEIVELRLGRGGRTVGVTVLVIIFVDVITVLMGHGWKLGTCLRLRAATSGTLASTCSACAFALPADFVECAACAAVLSE